MKYDTWHALTIDNRSSINIMIINNYRQMYITVNIRTGAVDKD